MEKGTLKIPHSLRTRKELPEFEHCLPVLIWQFAPEQPHREKSVLEPLATLLDKDWPSSVTLRTWVTLKGKSKFYQRRPVPFKRRHVALFPRGVSSIRL